jgi:hypothetical protein
MAGKAWLAVGGGFEQPGRSRSVARLRREKRTRDRFA